MASPPESGIVVARHGRSTWNAEGRFQGHGDPPLDTVGRAQAGALAAALARMRRRPALVASSDLSRATETAAAVADRCRVPVHTMPELREVDVGTWQGLTVAEVRVRFPDEYARWTADPHNGGFRRGGGETLAEAGARVAAALHSIAARWPHTCVVVVSHGLALQAALRVLGQDDPPHLENGQWMAVEGWRACV
jgi:glucosyl-3-phosphoglycerate phosphatase